MVQPHYRLWYDIMLIYGKMYSAHLCHFVIRFSAGNLIWRNYALDAQIKSTSAPLAITGLLSLTYYFSDVAWLAFQQSSNFSSVVIWFSVKCGADSKWNQSTGSQWVYQPFMAYLTCNKGSILHWGSLHTSIHTKPLGGESHCFRKMYIHSAFMEHLNTFISL